MQTIVFTDLDGTLLDRRSYAWEPARPALDLLRSRGVPLVFVTSKTRAEVLHWRSELANHHPFIYENGGAACLPPGLFPSAAARPLRDGLELLEWGTPYPALLADLAGASARSACSVRGFHSMTDSDVAALCELPLPMAALARRREYDEPFLVDSPGREPLLATAIRAAGRRSTQGGRLWHITGRNDKGVAVRALTELYSAILGAVRTIGLGDGLNDAPLLDAVDVPVLINSPQVHSVHAVVPRARVTTHPGPVGWNEALVGLIP